MQRVSASHRHRRRYYILLLYYRCIASDNKPSFMVVIIIKKKKYTHKHVLRLLRLSAIIYTSVYTQCTQAYFIEKRFKQKLMQVLLLLLSLLYLHAMHIFLKTRVSVMTRSRYDQATSYHIECVLRHCITSKVKLLFLVRVCRARIILDNAKYMFRMF